MSSNKPFNEWPGFEKVHFHGSNGLHRNSTLGEIRQAVNERKQQKHSRFMDKFGAVFSYLFIAGVAAMAACILVNFLSK